MKKEKNHSIGVLTINKQCFTRENLEDFEKKETLKEKLNFSE